MAPQPRLLDRYQLEEVVGSGSFGRVFRVLDTRTGERRALKIVPRGDHEALLLAEFEQLARLHHPSLPRVFEVGRTREPIEEVAAGAPFFVAEWIAGPRSDHAPWSGSASALWTLIADLAGALATIHGGGLVHGDVAPQNVLLADDRAVLVDLGLASGEGARGTPAYLAPEALAGRGEPRSDLYGLGATLIRMITGRPPVEAATLGELAQRILAGVPRPALDGIPAPLANLIWRLVSRDAEARPASALAVLDELDQLAPAVVDPGDHLRAPLRPAARPSLAAPPTPTRWPGAATLIDAIVRSLVASDAMLTSPSPSPSPSPSASVADAVVVVVGAAGLGARALADAALQRWQLARVAGPRAATAVTGTLAGTLDEVASLLAVAAPTTTSSTRAFVEQVARAARGRSELVLIDGIEDPRAADLVAALARAPGAQPVIVVLDHAPPPRPGVALHEARALDHDGIAELASGMLGRPAPHAWVHGLLVASGGLPVTAIELVRSIAGDPDPFAIDWSERSSHGAAALRARQLVALDAGPRRLVAALAVWGGRARIDRVLATLRREAPRIGQTSAPAGLADILALERVGLVARHGDELAIARATADAIAQELGPDELARLAAAALDAVDDERAPEDAPEDDDDRVPPPWIAPLFERAPLQGARALRACAVAEHLLARGRADRALAISRRAIASVPARAGLIAARAAAAVGAYRDAIDLARAAEAAGAGAAEAQLVVARAAQRGGDLDLAEAVLAKLHADQPEHTAIAGTYARLLVTRSRYADARAAALRPGSPLAGLRAEAAGLAAFYLGDLADADAAFAALELAATADADLATIGRALSLRGMVAQQRGQLGLASERYRDAADRLHEIGESHAAATAELNLGTVLAERGRASEALPRLVAAGRVFAELGATTELCAAEINRGNALLALGQLEGAREAAGSGVAGAAGAPHLRAFALLVLGDVHARRGDPAGALATYREALEIAVARGDAHAQISAHIALAELGIPEATTSTPEAEIEALCASSDDRDRWTLARARRLLDDPASPAASVGALATACAEIAARAGDADRLERAYRGHALACALARRARHDALATTSAERARAAHAAWVAAAAPAFRPVLAADRDLAMLPDPARDRAVAAPARDDAAPLRRLLTLSRRLNTEASVERILDDVIDTAIELSHAERGFLLLRQADGELAAVVSRNFAAADLEASTSTVSRSIAERAAQTGEPVLTVDAGIDERFGAAASVAALRLRSVLAVPLRQRGTVTGCIYVDHRLRGGAFDDGAAGVLGELADIAAIAIENARLTEDLRRTTRAVDELNARLSVELAERDAELVRVKSELPDRDRLRHRYDQIAGRSPAMVRMLDVVDRAAATSLPVVVVGESGTGKELVARALHDHGPRQGRPFVAINCSAVPEPLLESELFGHVRGAFTGADRDRRGLFEVADGGTLFLDEIADTSPAMQAKLLRVLQDGVLRRVGDTSTRKVDVRVIAATQHPLAELVAAGRFREDLRFRLEVIAVPVPPLRDREGDIPLLVERLLARLVPGQPAPRLTRAALRALAQHRWPGNVRELENALARGIAMGGDVIDLEDLPETVASAAARPEPARPPLGEDLQLKPALAATEQAYIGAAMARAKGNQTVAARLLGLSRFGLQKKLRRLAEDDAAPDER